MELKGAISAGRVLLPQLGARPFEVGAIPNSGVPDSVQDPHPVHAVSQGRAPLIDQQQSTSKNCMCRGRRAGCAAFLQSCHRRLAAWQSKHLLAGSWTSSEPFQEVTGILQNSASLREPGGAALPPLHAEMCPCATCGWCGIDEILLRATTCQFALLQFLSTATSLPTSPLTPSFLFFRRGQAALRESRSQNRHK